ncbi:MAG: cation-transporting ATPase [Acidimicrobiia bacterium]|nr:cation-transporting ATPase [Acidimicrobiia bacterium]
MTTTTTYTVTGMTCGHCVAAVTKEIEALAGVEQVEVHLEAATAVVTGTASTEAVLAAVVEAGYDARPQR